jgi:hypothetical protein
MTFILRLTDYPEQGPGHLGRQYRRAEAAKREKAA